MAQLKDTVVAGSLRTTDTIYSTTGQFKIIKAATSSSNAAYSAGNAGQILRSGGASGQAYWGSLASSDIPAINLSTASVTTGTLPVNRGGTGVSSVTPNAIITGNTSTATSPFSAIATNNGAFYCTTSNGQATFGTLPIAQGGTGSTSASGARTNLGLGSMAVETATNYLKWQTTTSASTALYNFGVYINNNAAAGTGPSGSNYFNILNIPYRKATGNTKSDWGWQLGNSTGNDSKLFYRTSTADSFGDWQIVAHATTTSSNIGSTTQPVYMTSAGVIAACTAYSSASVNYATSAGSASKANAANISTTINAIAKYSDENGTFANSGVTIDANNNINTSGTMLETAAGRMQKVVLIPATTWANCTADTWYRCCKITSKYDYANCIVLLSGGWSTGAPTMATIGIQIRNTTANITLLQCAYVNNIKCMRLVDDGSHKYWLDVQLNMQSSGNLSAQTATFIGNVTISDINTTLTTAPSSTAAATINFTTLYSNNSDYNIGATVKATKFVGPLEGTATNSTWTTLLKPISTNTTASASSWNIPSGSYQVWGERFSDSRLKYTPEGGSETTITDTGDWTMWLTPSGSAATLNMRIDGNYYGGFVGNLTGTASKATSANITSTKNGIAYYSNTSGTFASTAAGTAGQYLKSNGANSAPTWDTPVTSIEGMTGAISLSQLGITGAMHYQGTVATIPPTTGTYASGDVVVLSGTVKEYVYDGSSWRELGTEGSFKTTQPAVTDSGASTSATTTFVQAVTQNQNGVITVTKASLNTTGAWAGTAGTVKGSYTSNGGKQNPDYFGTNKVGFLMMNTTVNNNSQYKDWIIMDCYNNNDVGGGVAFGVNRQSLGAYIMRSAAARTSWAESAELLGTHNYTDYTVTKTGGGASGTNWAISITGSANSATTATNLANAPTITTSTASSTALAANSTYDFNVGGKKVTFKTPPDNDTKNTAGATSTDSKIYLIGATSTGTNPQTYGYNYLFAEKGALSAKTLNINAGTGDNQATLQWNSSLRAVEFVFA